MKKFFIILLLISFDALSEERLQPVNIFSASGESFSDKEIFGRIVSDLNYKDNYESSDSKDNYRETEARIRFLMGFNLAKNLSINTQLNLSPLYKNSENDIRNSSVNGGGDRSFEDHALVMRELYLKYNAEQYTLIAGKANLAYGTAWRWNRGIWTYELANNYRQVGKLAAGGVYHLGNIKTSGQYNFGFSFFQNDRKKFDNSLLTSNDVVNKSDAEPGDDNFFKSYIATLDIKFDFGIREKLSYHFGYINLSVNDRFTAVPKNNIKDQKGFVLGINYQYPIVKNYDIDVLAEYSVMNNLGGNSNYKENYFTANIIHKLYDHWNLTLGYADYESNLLQRNGFNQSMKELSFGYEFKKNNIFDLFLIQLGYKDMRNDYQSYARNIDSFGILLRYYKNF